MSTRFTLQGLEDLKAQLRALPAELTTEGGHIVEGRANGATSVIKAGYPSKRGDLRDKLAVTHTRSRFGARSVIRNTSKHAAPFEQGSEARHYVSHKGVRHLTGKMPPTPIFSKTIVRERRAMYRDLADLLTRHGLRVTGAP